MFSNRHRETGRSQKHKSKSSKERKLSKLIASDSDTEADSEHELSYYIEDRVKLMKEVLKIIKPRKMKSMAPDCMKNMELQEINSMLLEELLGISNKRLKYIFEGKTLEEESSTDEDQPIDVISLDDVSDDDFVVISDDESDKKHDKRKRKKVKEEPKDKPKKIKKEKTDKDKDKSKDADKSKKKSDKAERRISKEKEPIGEENLMSVLELLELQARARAIRSQLELESKRKQEEKLLKEKEKALQNKIQEEDDEIIVEVPKDEEIVISSSDSEDEENKAGSSRNTTEKLHQRSSPTKTKSSRENQNTQIDQISSQDSHNGSKEMDNLAKTTDLSKGTDQPLHKPIEDKDQQLSDKEEGEVSDTDQPDKSACSDVSKGAEIVENAANSRSGMSRSACESESDGSSSNDNLQVVMEREKRKISRKKRNLRQSASEAEDSDSESKEIEDKPIQQSTLETNKTDSENVKENETDVNADSKKFEKVEQHTENPATIQNKECEQQQDNPSDPVDTDNSSQANSSKLEIVIEEFIKTQPPPPDNTEELERLERENKEKEEKLKKIKEKRFKTFKVKLQSYKEDVAVESCTVNVLENIIIKPKTVTDDIRHQTEESDGLVINVDQDDLDCIICD